MSPNYTSVIDFWFQADRPPSIFKPFSELRSYNINQWQHVDQLLILFFFKSCSLSNSISALLLVLTNWWLISLEAWTQRTGTSSLKIWQYLGTTSESSSLSRHGHYSHRILANTLKSLRWRGAWNDFWSDLLVLSVERESKFTSNVEDVMIGVGGLGPWGLFALCVYREFTFLSSLVS